MGKFFNFKFFSFLAPRVYIKTIKPTKKTHSKNRMNDFCFFIELNSLSYLRIRKKQKKKKKKKKKRRSKKDETIFFFTHSK